MLGILQPPLPLPSGGIQNVTPLFFVSQTPDPKDVPINPSNYLGNPVYSNLVFQQTDGISALTIDTVLFNVSVEKNIILTPIQGRNGTVKEYISMGDYEITIQGELVSPYPDVMPKDELSILKEFLTLNKPIGIESSFLQIFPVHSIVVMGFNIAEKMGYRNEIPFTIRAVSDIPIDINSAKI